MFFNGHNYLLMYLFDENGLLAIVHFSVRLDLSGSGSCSVIPLIRQDNTCTPNDNACDVNVLGGSH